MVIETIAAVGPAILQGIAGIVGGNSAQKQSDRNFWRQVNVDHLRFLEANKLQKQEADLDRQINANLSREFAKNSTGWAFRDLMQAADESGIHRLAALGAAGSGSGYAHVGGSGAVTGAAAPNAAFTGGSNGIGDGLRAAGSALEAFGGLQQRRKANARQERLQGAQVRVAEAQATLAEARAKSIEKEMEARVRNEKAATHEAGSRGRTTYNAPIGPASSDLEEVYDPRTGETRLVTRTGQPGVEEMAGGWISRNLINKLPDMKDVRKWGKENSASGRRTVARKPPETGGRPPFDLIKEATKIKIANPKMSWDESIEKALKGQN